MKFSKKRPNKEGYYWYRKHHAYAPTIGRLGKYYDGSGWFVTPFYGDIDDDKKLTGEELWGSRIEEP